MLYSDGFNPIKKFMSLTNTVVSFIGKIKFYFILPLVSIHWQRLFSSDEIRVGKNPGFFKKTQPGGFFGAFWGFFGFYWVLLGFLNLVSVT